MRHTTAALALLLAAAPLPAHAQARFQTGALSWTPLFTLRDAGLDTNIYDEATNPKRDHVAVVTPEIDGRLDSPAVRLSFGATAEFAYFRQYTNERSINTRSHVRVDIPLSRVRPFASMRYVNARERQNSEIDLRARRSERAGSLGVGLQLTSRAVIEMGARADDLKFRQGQLFNGVDLAERLNRETTGATALFRYDVSPLTRFTGDVDVSRDRFVNNREHDVEHVRLHGAFDFSPDAVVKGRASVGYHKMKALGSLAFGFEGVTTAVDLGYVLLGRTRFDARIGRDSAFSFEAHPYYLHTTYGGEVRHNLFGPVDLIARGARERLEYPGIPERALEPYLLRVSRYGGAVEVRAAERLRFSVNYEAAERIGSDPAQRFDRTFERRRLFTTVTYGF